MDKKKSLRTSLILAVLMMGTSFGNYTRLSGTENIRPIHVVTLLTCGVGIGIFLVSLIMLIRSKKDQ
jgi:hypothetical protein